MATAAAAHVVGETIADCFRGSAAINILAALKTYGDADPFSWREAQ